MYRVLVAARVEPEPTYSVPWEAVGRLSSWMPDRETPVAADTALYTELAGKVTEEPRWVTP